ncbi:hypothetical protein Dimus_025641 [Dionaea muscipula]
MCGLRSVRESLEDVPCASLFSGTARQRASSTAALVQLQARIRFESRMACGRLGHGQPHSIVTSDSGAIVFVSQSLLLIREMKSHHGSFGQKDVGEVEDGVVAPARTGHAGGVAVEQDAESFLPTTPGRSPGVGHSIGV